MPHLIVKEGHNRGEVIPVRTRPVTLGRDLAVDVLASDSDASRRHARISRRDGAYRIEDLKSRNGTWVNGTRIERRLLRHMDEIRIGRCRWIFVEEETRGAASAAPGTTQLSTPARDELIGQSPRMKEVYRRIEKAAACDVPILIVGESGTGKELAAKTIHRNGARSARPFGIVNCAAIPEALAESEFFGHEAGAFTGAIARKFGQFEAAGGGTLFLDEVAEASAAVQAKLLRAVERGEFRRVGSAETLHADVRIIAASSRDDRIREDLLHRLSGIRIEMPPLRERWSDLPLLCRHFIDLLGKRVRGATEEVYRALERHSWPGNVRELRNTIERAVLFCSGDEVTLRDVPWIASEKGGGPSLEAVESEHVRKVLEECGWNLQEAARRLGIHRSTLYRKMLAYHIERP